MTTPFRETQGRIGRQAMAGAVIVGAALIAVGNVPAGKGVILGSLFSVLNFVIMGQTLPLQVRPTRKSATVASFFGILARYAVLAVPLYLAIRYDAFSFPATIIGIFAVQVTILGDLFYRMAAGRRK